MPRTNSCRATSLVTGEPEQVPRVVHELVDLHAADDAQRALLHAHEVDEDEQDDAGEECVGGELPRRDDRDGGRPVLEAGVGGHGGGLYAQVLTPASANVCIPSCAAAASLRTA